MNEVMDTLLSHRSIRKYKERPVEEEILDQIVKAVQAAPNRVNLQHVSVIAIKDKARREKFSELCGGQKYIAQAPVFLVFCADFYRTWIACRQNGQPFEDAAGQIDNLIVGANEVGIALSRHICASRPDIQGTPFELKFVILLCHINNIRAMGIYHCIRSGSRKNICLLNQ